MKNYESIKRAVEALSAETIASISANERLACELTKSEKFALVRFADIAKAVNNKLSSMRLSVDVDYCKDDRLTLFYLVSNDEQKSYIVKLYLSSVTSEKCVAYMYAHSALVKLIEADEQLSKLARDSKKAFVIDYSELASVIKAVIALSKAK